MNSLNKQRVNVEYALNSYSSQNNLKAAGGFCQSHKLTKDVYGREVGDLGVKRYDGNCGNTHDASQNVSAILQREHNLRPNFSMHQPSQPPSQPPSQLFQSSYQPQPQQQPQQPSLSQSASQGKSRNKPQGTFFANSLEPSFESVSPYTFTNQSNDLRIVPDNSIRSYYKSPIEYHM